MDNLIGRHQAIDEANAWLLECLGVQKQDRSCGLIRRLEDLPSAQPERKHGYWTESHEHVYIGNGVKEWINWYCSECDAPNDKPTDFCPNCGSYMEGDADE